MSDKAQLNSLLYHLFSTDEKVREQGYNILFDASLPELEANFTLDVLPYLDLLVQKSQDSDLIILLAHMSCNVVFHLKHHLHDPYYKQIAQSLAKLNELPLYSSQDIDEHVLIRLKHCFEELRQLIF